jgi:hypothetical protein
MPTAVLFSEQTRVACMQTIVKAADDAALLALVPHLIGMHPHNSVVLLGFRGNRTYGGMRFDLPVPTGASPALVYKRVSKTLVGMLGKLPGADGVVVAVVTDETFGESAVPPQLDFVAELTRCIDRSRYALKGVLCQAGDGWAPYFDSRVPVGGFPLTDVADADIASQLPPDLPDPFDVDSVPPRVPDAPGDVKARVMSDLHYVQDTASSIDARFLSDKVAGLVKFAENALNFTDEEFVRVAGRYLYSLQHARFSDPVMLQWASEADTAVRLWTEVVNFQVGDDLDGSECVDMLNGLGRRPDPERVERGVQFLLRLVACADDTVRSRPLTMLAWLHWALGRGSLADVYLSEARRLTPQDPRVDELDVVIRTGGLPPWLFDSEVDFDDSRDDDVDDFYWDDDDDDDDDDRDDWENRPHNPF